VAESGREESSLTFHAPAFIRENGWGVASGGAGWVTGWARAVGGKGRLIFLYSGPRLYHKETSPRLSGELSYARMVHLIGQYRQRRDETKMSARTLEGSGSPGDACGRRGSRTHQEPGGATLRFTVLWRKMMQGTVSVKGDRSLELILLVRETCHLRGILTLPTLMGGVACSFNGEAA
jgi:hypothetical protein